jgi:hypothetical protein
MRDAPAEVRALLPSSSDLERKLTEPPEPGIPPPSSKAAVCDDVMTIGHGFGTEDAPRDSQFIPIGEALANDFQAGFEEAFARYAHDSDAENPNPAPKECWPSTPEFRNILFKAGQHLGLAAVKYLDRVPDVDLRLFAQIELCAAIAGLRQISGTIMFHPRRARRSMRAAAVLDVEPVESEEGISGRDPGGPRIRCPKCRWTPRAEDRWVCHCGHTWNTFDTGGMCPGCQYRWTIAMCPKCGQWSAHSDWYVGE